MFDRKAKQASIVNAATVALVLGATVLVGLGAVTATDPCGYGPQYVNQLKGFSHEVEFTVRVSEDSGYLVDCTQGVDAFFDFDHQGADGTYYYWVTGQLGDYS